MTKLIHYNIDDLDSKGALINLLLGERSNGKSYQVKHKKGILKYLSETVNYYTNYKDKEHVIKEYIKKGSRFMLIRRLVEEIKPANIEPYFADVDIYKLTDGKYNCITLYKNKLWLSNYDSETGKTKRYEHIGYVIALSVEQNYAGGSFLDVTDIIFEEFISRTIYLKDEPNKLMNLYSTVDRKRGTTRLWLCGNTISKVCPYFNDWELDDLLKNMEQGDIKEKWISTGEFDDEGFPVSIKIAIEYCKSTGRSSFAIGTHKNMLNSGAWQSDPQPKLPKSINDYKELFKIGFYYKNFKFLAKYILDPLTKDTVWFIYPYKGEFKKNLIVFSDIIKTSPYWQRDIYLPSFKNEKIKKILQTFKENQIFYSDDNTGTDFKQVIDFVIKK